MAAISEQQSFSDASASISGIIPGIFPVQQQRLISDKYLSTDEALWLRSQKQNENEMELNDVDFNRPNLQPYH